MAQDDSVARLEAQLGASASCSNSAPNPEDVASRNAEAEIRVLDPQTVELRPFPRTAMVAVFGTSEGLVHECGTRYAPVPDDPESRVGMPESLAIRVIRGLRPAAEDS